MGEMMSQGEQQLKWWLRQTEFVEKKRRGEKDEENEKTMEKEKGNKKRIKGRGDDYKYYDIRLHLEIYASFFPLTTDTPFALSSHARPLQCVFLLCIPR